MAYFVDFSEYTYSPHHRRAGTHNIGWLDHAHSYEKAEAPDDIVDLLWSFCGYSIAQARGFHLCDLPDCIASREGSGPLWEARAGTLFELGSAEIRVFDNDGLIYAAPNLIYHYVTAHRYRLPDRFIGALTAGPKPNSAEYEGRLKELGLKWTRTLGKRVTPKY